MEKNKRVVVYMRPKAHKQLKAILSLDGKTVSEWFREQAIELIEGYDKHGE